MPKHTYSLAATILASALSLSAQVQQQEAKLPAPFATPSADNGPRVVARPDGAQLQVPHGFEIEEYATGFQTPRFMLTGPSGEIILSDSSAGTVYVLVDKNKSYKNPERKKILEGLTRPCGRPSPVSIRTAAATRSLPPARAIRSACTGIRTRITCGRPFRNGTPWETIWCRTTSRIFSKAGFTDGPMRMPGRTKSRGTRA